jgi:hypothetical protein
VLADREETKKEARNRRVEVFGVRDAAPAKTTQTKHDPIPPPKPPNIWDIPDKIKKQLEEKDRQALRQRMFDPIPKLPPGKSLRQWLPERLWSCRGRCAMASRTLPSAAPARV